jgi:Carboxypeptidase regulatory-like domain
MDAAGIVLVALLAQTPAASQPSQGGATVEGTVILAGTGQPLSGAKVQLFRAFLQRRGGGPPSPDGGPPPDLGDITPHAVTTAQDGRFLFENIKPGEYRLAAFRSGGYVPAEFAQRSPTSVGISFELAGGQKMQGVQLALTPTGSISGRVYDRDGPVGKLQVQALRPIYREGKRTLTIVQSVQTNDRGEYRLFWLPPGQYYLTAKPFSDGAIGAVFITEPTRLGTFEQASSPIVTTRTLPGGELVEETQLPVYYPGTTDVNGATRVDLRPGAMADGLDIAITTGPVRTRHLRGVALANGQPAALAGIKAIPRASDPSLVIAAGRTNADGSFDVSGVAPGSYFLFASTNSGMTGGLAMQVGDADVDNIVIPMTSGIRVSGRFVIEGRSRNDDGLEMANLRITLTRDPNLIGMPPAGPSFSPPPSADGSFVLQDVPPGDLRVSVRALPPDAYIKSIRMGSADVLDGGLHITGTPRDLLEVVIGADAGRLSGTVMNTRQEPLANIKVAVVPGAPDRERSDLYKSTTTDQSGRFRIQGLAAGSYTVFAWEEIEDGAWQDPDVIRAYESRGTSIRIRDGADESVQLTAIR